MTVATRLDIRVVDDSDEGPSTVVQFGEPGEADAFAAVFRGAVADPVLLLQAALTAGWELFAHPMPSTSVDSATGTLRVGITVERPDLEPVEITRFFPLSGALPQGRVVELFAPVAAVVRSL